MKISKGDLVNGAMSVIRISGLTVKPSPDVLHSGAVEADDLAMELKGSGIDLGWNAPTEYGGSDPSDNSGLTPEMAGPFKSVLAVRLLDFFGKVPTPTLISRESKGIRALEQMAVEVNSSCFPSTLPIGSGNNYYGYDNDYYDEKAQEDGLIDVFKGDVLTVTEDFGAWLGESDLDTVDWESNSSDTVISNKSNDLTTATAELSFIGEGHTVVCITATKTGSNDIYTVQRTYRAKGCDRVTYGYLSTL